MSNFEGGFLSIFFTAMIFLIGGIYLISRIKSNRSSEKVNIESENLYSNKLQEFDLVNDQEAGVIIPITQLPSNIILDDSNLFEITDNLVIARISETIPNAAEMIAKTINSNALNKVEIFEALIPSGAKLLGSRNTEGAVRGIYRDAKGIKGHADLLKLDPAKISKAGAVANGIANVVNVGSLVVGQYYMSEINSKLETISEDISDIADFQEREFKSRILSLIARVQKISSFSTEILESDDLRKKKLQTLDDLEGEGSQLLQQVNLAIDELFKKYQKLDYLKYLKKVDEFSIQIHYQKILLSILGEISKLIYLFGKGEVSCDLSYSIFNVYLDQSKQTRKALEIWHNLQIKSIGIDIPGNRVRRKGVDGMLAGIPAIIDKKWNYKKLKNGFAQKIEVQIANDYIVQTQQLDSYKQDIQIVIKDGKYFLLKDNSCIS